MEVRRQDFVSGKTNLQALTAVSMRAETGPPDRVGKESQREKAGRPPEPGAGFLSKVTSFLGWSQATARRADLHLQPPEPEKLLWRPPWGSTMSLVQIATDFRLKAVSCCQLPGWARPVGGPLQGQQSG